MVQLLFPSQSTQQTDGGMESEGASQLPDMMKDRCHLNPPLSLELESDSEEPFRNSTNAMPPLLPLEPLLSQQPSVSQSYSQFPASQMQWCVCPQACLPAGFFLPGVCLAAASCET